MEINNKLFALFEGREWLSHGMPELRCNPDYSNPADRECLLQYLMGQGEMWKKFEAWVLKERWGWHWEISDSLFIPWLFLPVDSIPRWVLLLQEWLGLDTTRERFGTIDCNHCYGIETHLPNGISCPMCHGSGKVSALWALGE